MYNFPRTNPGLVSISFELTTQWLITTTQSRISLRRVRLKYVTISTVLSTFHALLNEMEMKDSDTKLKKTASSLQSNLSICISYTSIITRFALRKYNTDHMSYIVFYLSSSKPSKMH